MRRPRSTGSCSCASRARTAPTTPSGSTTGPDRAGSSPAARSPASTATRRCSSAGCGRCSSRRCTRPRCAVSPSTPATAATRGAGSRAPAGSSRSPRSAPPTTPQQAVDIVRSIHERVVGTMPDGTPYAATDPHLLGWVHVAEIDSFLRAHTVYGRDPLDRRRPRQYVAQTAEVARRLGVLTRRRPRPSWRPTPGGVPSRAARAPRGPRGRRRYLLCSRRCRCSPGRRTASGRGRRVGLMPRWTRRPLRLPWLPVPSAPWCARSAGWRPARSGGR